MATDAASGADGFEPEEVQRVDMATKTLPASVKAKRDLQIMTADGGTFRNMLSPDQRPLHGHSSPGRGAGGTARLRPHDGDAGERDEEMRQERPGTDAVRTSHQSPFAGRGRLVPRRHGLYRRPD